MPGSFRACPQSLHGRAHVELAQAQIQHGVITQLEGRIEARDLEDRSGANTALGSYLVTFPGGSGEPTGRLRDLDGPLALEGTLRLTPQPGFELEGLIAPRHGAPPELVNNIRFLGCPRRLRPAAVLARRHVLTGHAMTGRSPTGRIGCSLWLLLQ